MAGTRSARRMHLARRAAALVGVAGAFVSTTIVVTAPAAVAANKGSSIGQGTTLIAGDYLQSPSGAYRLVMQGDGNLVVYNGGTALWASNTNGNSGAYLAFQGDGNLVVYLPGGHPLWWSHTNPMSGMRLVMQDDGNLVMVQGSTPIWNTATAADERRCWVTNACTVTTFSWAFLGIPPEAPYVGVNAPLTMANLYAMTKWAAAENTAARCNPLATTQREPGSTNFNSVGVQNFTTTDANHTCWYWGIVANDQVVQNGLYPPILNALRNPVLDAHAQCVSLAKAVGNTPWGTGDFEHLC